MWITQIRHPLPFLENAKHDKLVFFCGLSHARLTLKVFTLVRLHSLHVIRRLTEDVDFHPAKHCGPRLLFFCSSGSILLFFEAVRVSLSVHLHATLCRLCSAKNILYVTCGCVCRLGNVVVVYTDLQCMSFLFSVIKGKGHKLSYQTN